MSTPTDIDTGGPAFALPGLPFYVDGVVPQSPYAGYGWAHDPQPGMSLLDWFAGQALAGWAAGRNNGGDFNEPSPSKAEFVARSCYQYADAMIEARKQKGTA